MVNSAPLIKRAGFTIIEVLIVMAILGTLAVLVFIAVNPVEKQAQARDTGRLSSVTQIGHALQDYYTSAGAMYPSTGNWAQNMIDKGSMSVFPSGIEYKAYSITSCTTVPQPASPRTYCYDEDEASGNGAIVFAKAEAESHRSKCVSGDAYFVFSTVDGRGGTICSGVDPTAWASGTQTYAD